MGTGTYNQHEQQQQHHQKNLERNGKLAAPNSSTKNKTFLPIICRSSSVKDSIIAHNRPRNICHKKDDPSSPRVSCMGQVKHHQQQHSSTSFKLLTPPSTTTKHPNKLYSGNTRLHLYSQKIIDERRNIRRPCSRFSTSSSSSANDNCATVVPLNLAELDPPLPVVKRLPQQPVLMSIWKRRSKEGGLPNLQIPTFQCIYAIATSTPLQKLDLGPPTSL